jgi:hypothetical protein
MYKYLCFCVCMYVRMYVCIYVCMYGRMYVGKDGCLYACICMNVQATKHLNYGTHLKCKSKV